MVHVFLKQINLMSMMNLEVDEYANTVMQYIC